MKHFSGSILLLGLLAFNANAQTDSSNTSILSDVTITANRYAQKQNQTGKVVSIISAQQIERSAGKTLGQLLNEQAGITINGAFNTLGSNQSLYMRGAATGRTLVLIDGIPAFDPSLINSEFDLNLISLNEVERIEICRGAQSTIYGSDAIAGVINIITTKKNITKPFNLKASVVGGSFGTFKGNVQLYGKAGKLSYTTRYARLQNTGFSSAYDSTGKGGFDKDGYAGNQASAQLQYAITPALSVKTFVQFSGYKSDIDQSAFIDDRDFTIDNQSLMTGVGMAWNGKKIKLNANYQYSDINRNYLNDSAHTPGFNKFEQNDYFGKNQFVELFGNITLAKGLTLLAGADYRHNQMNNQYQSLSMFGWYNSNFRDTSVNQISGYGSLLFASANQKLHLELGGRLNHHSRYGNATTFTFNPSFLLHENYRLFGSIASGFKAPTLYQLFADFSGNPDLKAEKSVNYEFGIQQQHAKISNRLVYFYRNISNGIDYNYVTNKYFNFIEQKVQGIEWETQIKAYEKINVTANYTWLAGQENTQSRINTNDTTYTYLLRRPAHQLNLSIDYTPIAALSLGLSGRYTSKRNDVGGYQKADIELDPYFLLNAYGEYRIKPWVTIFANAQNLTNTRFFELVGYNAARLQIMAGLRIAL